MTSFEPLDPVMPEAIFPDFFQIKFYAELSYVCAGCEYTTNLFTCFISYSEVTESESHSVVSDSL